MALLGVWIYGACVANKQGISLLSLIPHFQTISKTSLTLSPTYILNPTFSYHVPYLNSALSHHHPHLSAPSGPFEQYMLLSSSALSPPVSSSSYSGEKLKPLKMFYKTFFFLTSNSSPHYSVCLSSTDIIVVSRTCQVSPRAMSLVLPFV